MGVAVLQERGEHRPAALRLCDGFDPTAPRYLYDSLREIAAAVEDALRRGAGNLDIPGSRLGHRCETVDHRVGEFRGEVSGYVLISFVLGQIGEDDLEVAPGRGGVKDAVTGILVAIAGADALCDEHGGDERNRPVYRPNGPRIGSTQPGHE